MFNVCKNKQLLNDFININDDNPDIGDNYQV